MGREREGEKSLANPVYLVARCLVGTLQKLWTARPVTKQNISKGHSVGYNLVRPSQS